MRSKHLTKLEREGGDGKKGGDGGGGLAASEWQGVGGAAGVWAGGVNDSCDKLQKQNYLSIKLDFTNVLLPDSPPTEEISQHYRAA